MDIHSGVEMHLHCCR